MTVLNSLVNITLKRVTTEAPAHPDTSILNLFVDNVTGRVSVEAPVYPNADISNSPTIMHITAGAPVYPNPHILNESADDVDSHTIAEVPVHPNVSFLKGILKLITQVLVPSNAVVLYVLNPFIITITDYTKVLVLRPILTTLHFLL